MKISIDNVFPCYHKTNNHIFLRKEYKQNLGEVIVIKSFSAAEFHLYIVTILKANVQIRFVLIRLFFCKSKKAFFFLSSSYLLLLF